MAAADFGPLEAEVARNTTVDASAIALLDGLAQQLQDAKNDPAAIQAIVDQMRTSSDSLAAAVSRNTPAAPGGGEGTPT